MTPSSALHPIGPALSPGHASSLLAGAPNNVRHKAVGNMHVHVSHGSLKNLFRTTLFLLSTAMAASFNLCHAESPNDPLPPQLQAMEDAGNEKLRQLTARFSELQSRCPQIVREQRADLDFTLERCARKKDVPFSFANYEKQLRTCTLPGIEGVARMVDVFSKEPMCKEQPSVKNCRGTQCPPPQELSAEYERNSTLLDALAVDANKVCASAFGVTLNTYKPQIEKCAMTSPTPTERIKCGNSVQVKWISALRSSAKKLCNVDLQP